MVFLTQEPLTIKGGDRRRRGFPISSSLLRHDAKDQKDRHKRDRKKTEKLRADYKLAQKYIEIKILYDAWTISTHDACFNAVRISSILL